MEKKISGNLVDGIFSLFCIALGIWFFYESIQLSKLSSSSGIGAGSFPKYISIALIICGLFLFFIRNRKKYTIEFNKTYLLIRHATFVFIYLCSIDIIGFYFSSLIFIPFLLLSTKEKRPKIIIGITALYLLISYLCFDLLLGVPLP